MFPLALGPLLILMSAGHGQPLRPYCTNQQKDWNVTSRHICLTHAESHQVVFASHMLRCHETTHCMAQFHLFAGDVDIYLRKMKN